MGKNAASLKNTIIVAPVYNEETTIESFLNKLTALHEKTPLGGLLLVDDGSTDKSQKIIAQKASSLPFPLRFVRLSRNFGPQAACLAGLTTATKWAEETGADWIGILDSDLQDDPFDFLLLVEESEDSDIVYAVRESREDGFMMKYFAPVFYHFLESRAQFHIPRNAGTFSLMRRPIAKIICAAADNNPYFPGLRAWIGFRQSGVPLVRRARLAGKSKMNLPRLAKLSLHAIFQYTNFALELILTVGIAVFTVSFFASLYVVVQKLLGGGGVAGATIILVLQFAALGLQMIVLGIITYMIQRLHENTNPQPTWVIQDDRIF